MIGGGAIGGGTTEVLKDVGSNVLGKVGKKLVEDGVDMALDLTQTATENGGLTGKDVLFSAVTSFGGDLVGAAKTNSTARNQLIDESPLSPGYADKYGVDFKDTDYVIKGKLDPNADFITRSAPGLGNNSGGAIEIVTNPNGVKLDSFNMIGE